MNRKAKSYIQYIRGNKIYTVTYSDTNFSGSFVSYVAIKKRTETRYTITNEVC